MGQRFTITEEERKQIRSLYEQSLEPVEKDDELMSWLENATVSPYIAPNPYSNGDLKIGIQIKGNDNKVLDLYDIKGNKRFSILINLIERLDITTETGKNVYTTQTEFKGEIEVIDNMYIQYGTFGQDSELIMKLKQFVNNGKGAKFIVTVTPRLSNDLLKTGSKLFTTKPNILVVQ